MTEKLKKQIKNELKAYQKKGIELELNEQEASPKEIAAACITAEEGSYMRDYAYDDSGNIRRINFRYIKN
jgi:hypothetical protein